MRSACRLGSLPSSFFVGFFFFFSPMSDGGTAGGQKGKLGEAVALKAGGGPAKVWKVPSPTQVNVTHRIHPLPVPQPLSDQLRYPRTDFNCTTYSVLNLLYLTAP